MHYNTPLIEAQFLKRYKRFFADFAIGKEVEVAHVPNTGSLKGICDAQRPCRVQKNDNPARKLKFTLEQVQTESSWVGVNTQTANMLAFEAFEKKIIPHWLKYQNIQKEVKINSESRLDLKLFNSSGEPHFVEVKSVTGRYKNGTAYFPDAATVRGQKHLNELMHLQNSGATTEMLFIVQRSDCSTFTPAYDIDPVYGQLLEKAYNAGVKISVYPALLNSDRIELNTASELKVIFSQPK
jgi:sugar fermentation stimulation protein A